MGGKNKMLILLSSISLLFLIFGIFSTIVSEYTAPSDRKNLFKKFKYFCYNHELFGPTIAVISLFLTTAFLVATLVVGVGYSESMVIDDKIALYQEENHNIETSIDATVQQYQHYEQETFEKCKVDPAVVLVMYPELKSNELVVKQIDLYTKNNEKIKELKSDKLDYKVYRWWLFFNKN
jgi:hypothetical protein